MKNNNRAVDPAHRGLTAKPLTRSPARVASLSAELSFKHPSALLPPTTIDRIRQRDYLAKRNINPKQPLQLDLLFPEARHANQRFIPNDYARSSLFTARNKKEPRRQFVQERLFHLHESVSILYTGVELRAEDDEVVFLQILHYSKSVPLGEPVSFSVGDIVADLGWARNGRYYDKARECISRMKASEVMVINEKAFGNGGASSLIQYYTFTNNGNGKPTDYKVWIDPNLIILFAGNTFTNHNWKPYLQLSPVARRLADYIESHKHPYPLPLEKFGHMCGSADTRRRSWRETVRRACTEVSTQTGKLVYLENDKIFALSTIDVR